MPRRKQSKGQCAYCGQAFAKGGMLKHLSVCAERQVAIQRADRKKGAAETLHHLRVQDTSLGEFWLDLEMRGSAALEDLDAYLRAIWLECCGHLSRFSYGVWGSDEIEMRRRVEEVLLPGAELTHIYDFGTSSITRVKAVGVREGKPATSRPIALMARNRMPEARRIECQQPAHWLCMECVIDENLWGTLCDEHAQTHPHTEYGEPVPLVNSPRLGLCGYDGPAEPPY